MILGPSWSASNWSRSNREPVGHAAALRADQADTSSRRLRRSRYVQGSLGCARRASRTTRGSAPPGASPGDPPLLFTGKAGMDLQPLLDGLLHVCGEAHGAPVALHGQLGGLDVELGLRAPALPLMPSEAREVGVDPLGRANDSMRPHGPQTRCAVGSARGGVASRSRCRGCSARPAPVEGLNRDEHLVTWAPSYRTPGCFAFAVRRVRGGLIRVGAQNRRSEHDYLVVTDSCRWHCAPVEPELWQDAAAKGMRPECRI